MHKEYYVLKIYMKLVLFATLLIGGMTIVNCEMYGEGRGLNLQLDRLQLFLVLIFECIAIIISFSVFLKTKDIHIEFGNKSKHVKFIVKDRKIHWFIFVILCAEIIFSLKTGNGVVGHAATTSGTIMSYLFNILKISAFMPIYYVVARNRSKKIYWINITFWIIYEILCGWTGTLLNVVFLELFLRIKENGLGTLKRIVCNMNSTMTFVALLFGAELYRYMYGVKNMIRYDYPFFPLGFVDGLERLVSRFTTYPLTIVAVQNRYSIAELFSRQGIWYSETISIFRSLLPGAIMGDKSFRIMGNLVLQSIYPDITNATSSNYCVWIYLLNLLESNFFGFSLSLIAIVLGLIISKKIIYAFDNGNKNVEILYYFLLFKFFTGSSLENLFGYGYIGMIYFIIVMWIFRIISIKRVVSI